MENQFLERLYDGRSTGERDADGGIGLHFHLASRRHGALACFWVRGSESPSQLRAETAGDAYVHRRAVFVGVGKTREKLDPIASIIRLQSFNHRDMGISDPFQKSVTITPELIGTIVYRKLDSLLVACGIRLAKGLGIDKSEIAGHVIGSGPKLLDGISNRWPEHLVQHLPLSKIQNWESTSGVRLYASG